METPGEHPFIALARTLARTLEAELRHILIRLATTAIALLACTVILITAAVTTVAVGIVHLGRGLVTLTEMLLGQSWCSEVVVGAFLLLIPCMLAALALRRPKSARKNDSV